MTHPVSINCCCTDELLAGGVPRNVACQLLQEREAAPFESWKDVCTRLPDMRLHRKQLQDANFYVGARNLNCTTPEKLAKLLDGRLAADKTVRLRDILGRIRLAALNDAEDQDGDAEEEDFQDWTDVQARVGLEQSDISELCSTGFYVQPAIAVDLNRCSELRLALIPSIGAEGARRLVRERESKGLFKSWDDVLTRMKGEYFGASKVEKLKLHRYFIGPCWQQEVSEVDVEMPSTPPLLDTPPHLSAFVDATACQLTPENSHSTAVLDELGSEKAETVLNNLLSVTSLSAAAVTTLGIATDSEVDMHLPAVATPQLGRDLNTASVLQIASVPGIGEKVAERVVAERSTSAGLFEDWEDVLKRMKGKGLGPAKVALLMKQGFHIGSSSVNPAAEGPIDPSRASHGADLAVEHTNVCRTAASASADSDNCQTAAWESVNASDVAAAALLDDIEDGADAAGKLADAAGKLAEAGGLVEVVTVTEMSRDDTGPWWKQGSGSQPFPPEFCTADAAATGSWEYFYDHITTSADGNTYCYRGRTLTLAEAAELRRSWHIRYPPAPAANTHGNGRETVAQRVAATSSTTSAGKRFRQRAWSQLADLDGSETIRKELGAEWWNRFRSDAFGNVVSIDAAGGSVCAFELDHIFPWSRGGLSVEANFMALHWYANRCVKNDKILDGLSTLERSQLSSGLQVEIFLELVKHRRAVVRHRRRTYDKHLVTLLTSGYGGLPQPLSAVLTRENALSILSKAYATAMQDLLNSSGHEKSMDVLAMDAEENSIS